MKKKQLFLMMAILMMAFGFAGCPVSDDDDLDTGKNTEKKDPKVDKKSLEFSAEGGTQSVKVTTSGYKRYGFALDNADKSWLSAEIVSGKKTINITAKANTTGKERSATVKCYVTDVENSTDAQRVYLPVKVTQKANGTPSVSPTSLTFESSGGTQSVKVTTANYKYGGCTIDDDAKSWLSRNYPGGGTIELTASPNTTGRERSTTVKCYATNAQKGTDDDTYFMNVKVTQKASEPSESRALKVISFNYRYYFTLQKSEEVNGKTTTDDPNRVQGFLFWSTSDEPETAIEKEIWKSIKYSAYVTGTTAYVLLEFNYKRKNDLGEDSNSAWKMSFEIPNFPLNTISSDKGYDNCKIMNVRYSSKHYTGSKLDSSQEFDATNLPGTVSSNGYYAAIGAGGKESEGVLISNFTSWSTGYDDIIGSPWTQRFQLIGDKDNSFGLTIELEFE